jgi:hypothetical protein
MFGNQNRDLLDSLMGFQIDVEGDRLPFSARLRRENVWSEKYADRAIREYKRFLYLLSVCEGELTPSDQIDQVWHLHLLYTKSYWIDLCQNTLGCQLHHMPTRGGGKELTRFKRQYQATLQRYAEVFGSEPPADIWPDVDERFRHADAFVRTNKAHYWFVRKPAQWLMAASASSLFLVACSQGEGGSGFWFLLKLALGLFAAYIIFKWLSDIGGKGGGGGGGCGGVGCGGCSGCGGCGG